MKNGHTEKKHKINRQKQEEKQLRNKEYRLMWKVSENHKNRQWREGGWEWGIEKEHIRKLKRTFEKIEKKDIERYNMMKVCHEKYVRAPNESSSRTGVVHHCPSLDSDDSCV